MSRRTSSPPNGEDHTRAQPRARQERTRLVPLAFPDVGGPHPADPYLQARRLWGHLILKVGRPRPQED
jgi:hypothetical protein